MEITQTNTKIKQLYELGQSIWLDFISCSLINDGQLSNLIDLGVTGITSNPTIFDKAISSSNDYDEKIKELKNKGLNVFEIYDELTVGDIKDAADLFMPIFKESKGIDGYISLEVNPSLAYNTKDTIKEAKRLHKKVNKPNVMFKIPATENGLEAGKILLSEGISINFTLIFSLEQYIRATDVYIKGAEEFFMRGGDLGSISSAASVFVSRIDTLTDSIIEIKLTDQKDILKKKILQSLYGKTAVANSKLIYQKFLEIFSNKEFLVLEEKGLRKQRVIWASTSAKNPAYNSLKYVTELIGKSTINTLPKSTIDIFLNEGIVQNTLNQEAEESQEIINKLKDFGIDIKEVCAQLLRGGIKAFEESFNFLLKSIEYKKQKL